MNSIMPSYLANFNKALDVSVVDGISDKMSGNFFKVKEANFITFYFNITYLYRLYFNTSKTNSQCFNTS